MFTDMNPIVINSGGGGEIQVYTEKFTGATQYISANGGTKSFTLPTGAKIYDVWVGISYLIISGTQLTGWGRRTKEDAQTDSTILFSYAGTDFSPKTTYNTNLNVTFNDNVVTLTNNSTQQTGIGCVYIHYLE